jgi:NAD(P)-dependent dehydrogenase (short-subunit alcohol dehydrogenase family)
MCDVRTPHSGLHGCAVVITGRRKEVLDAAVGQLQAAGITAAGLQGDVRNQEVCNDWVHTTVQTFGSLDVLVNCAAGNFLANASELTQGGFKTGTWFISSGVRWPAMYGQTSRPSSWQATAASVSLL